MKVRVHSIYRFNPCGWDILRPCAGAGFEPSPGSIVRVVNLYGCPKANTMGHCYIAPVAESDSKQPYYRGNFKMVSTSSLEPIK